MAATSVLLLVVVPVAIAGHTLRNSHQTDGIGHGWEARHNSFNGDYYYSAWTGHDHGEKFAGLYHYPNTHIHCSAGPGFGGADGRTLCEARVNSSSHQSYHDAPVHYDYSCRNYNDGHGICPHFMEPNS